MKKRVTESLLNAGKKNRLMGVSCISVLTVYLLLYHLCMKLYHNHNKIVCTFFLLCMFAGCSSFAYKGGETAAAAAGKADVRAAAEPVAEQGKEPAGTNGDALFYELELLDDKDVTEGYENSEFEYVNADERFDAEDILDENESYYGKNTDEADKSGKVKFDRDDWNLVLINKQHSIPDDYEFTLGKIPGGMKCDERIIPYLLEMLQAAKDDGVNLVICSPYRDINRQQVLFNRKITAYMKKGMSYMDAYRVTAQAVTVPGASEHQIGLALDIICDKYSFLNEGFGDTDAGKWLAAHSYEYGFVLRYPKGKEYITGIEYEPWHFRYVGKDAAEKITEEGITLEEFIDGLPD